MEHSMIASENTISDGQIETVVSRLRDALRKHRGEFPAAEIQLLLGTKNIGAKLLSPIRQIVDLKSTFIARLGVEVDRSLSPFLMLRSTEWSFTHDNFSDSDALYETMPKGKGETADIYLFKPQPGSELLLTDEYEMRGLIPADPYSLVAMNVAEPEFCLEHQNATIWENPEGDRCAVLVGKSRFGGTRILIYHTDRVTGWGRNDTCYFAGFKK